LATKKKKTKNDYKQNNNNEALCVSRFICMSQTSDLN